MRFKFGSFNLKNFGETAITKRDFQIIADIIRSEQFDVVAFQEILSEGKALEYMLNNLTKHTLPGWDIRWGEPPESSDFIKTKDKRGEGYAFIWNTKRMELASSSTVDGQRIYEPRSIDKALRYDSSIFARIPYYARFVPKAGGFFEFRIINVHLHFGDNTKTEIEKRKEEYEFLINRIYPTISTERRYGNNREAYTITMGDYNLNLYAPRGEAESCIIKNTYIDKPCQIIGKQKIVTVQDQLTTLKNRTQEDADEAKISSSRGYSQNYDHFSYDSNVFDNEGIKVKYKRVDAVRKYCSDDFDRYRTEVSDHVPISIEIIMNEKQVDTNDE